MSKQVAWIVAVDAHNEQAAGRTLVFNKKDLPSDVLRGVPSDKVHFVPLNIGFDVMDAIKQMRKEFGANVRISVTNKGVSLGVDGAWFVCDEDSGNIEFERCIERIKNGQKSGTS